MPGHLHVCGVGHVTRHAHRSRPTGLMKIVAWAVVLGRQVALGAQLIAWTTKPLRVRVVTIGARDAGVVHLALEKRGVRVDLVALLAVGVIKARHDQRRNIVVEQRRTGRVSIGDLCSARMALRACFNLAVALTRCAAMRVNSDNVAFRDSVREQIIRELIAALIQGFVSPTLVRID